MKTPSRARSSGGISSRFLPSKITSPPVTSYCGCPASTFASVDLPDPFGPIMACTSPLLTVRLMPFRISLPSTDAHKFLISNTWSPRSKSRLGSYKYYAPVGAITYQRSAVSFDQTCRKLTADFRYLLPIQLRLPISDPTGASLPPQTPWEAAKIRPYKNR